MKKFLISVLASVMIGATLTSCGAKDNNGTNVEQSDIKMSMSASDMTNKLVDAGMVIMPMPVDDQMAKELYHLNLDDVEEYGISETGISPGNSLIIIAKAKEGKVESVKASLDKVLEDKIGKAFYPEEKEIAEFVKANHRQPGTMELLKPFFGQSIVFVLMLAFFIPGLCYGVTAGTVKSHKDVIKALVKAMSSCGQVFVIIFISAQFVYVFTKSNIGIVIAVNLANILKDMGVTGVAAAVGLIFLTAFVNLFIGGASSKWLMLSPVFIPMFVELGLTPEYTQLAYRIGDSTTNIISPLMSYFPIIVGFAAKYSKNEEDMGMGTIIAMMLPYSMAFLFAWTGLFLIWTFLGIPIGPGVKMFM